MSLLLSCQTCLMPVAHLDTRRYPVGPSATYCPTCAGGARIATALGEA